MRLLVDADMLVFFICSACEEWSPFNKELLLEADPEKTWKGIETRLERCVEQCHDYFDETPEIVLCFSPKKNYRYDVFPDYKSNRKGKSKRVLYTQMKEKCERLYHCEQWDNIEADDVMGIMQEKDTVICTGDKDLLQIPGFHLNLRDPDSGVFTITEEEGMKLFYRQCISGDPVDGYHGIPMVGKQKAIKELETFGYNFTTVVNMYAKAMTPKTKTTTSAGGTKKIVRMKSVNRGLGYADALLTARLAYILRYPTDYVNGEVKLWEPA